MFRYVLYLIAIVFTVWTIGTSFTQVQSHERAVIRRFGRVLDHKPEQGLHIGLPWGIDRVDLAPVGRVRSITVGFVDKDDKEEDVVPVGQMLTGDHNLVNVQASINYRVREADVDKYVLQADNVDAFVARGAEALLAEWIAGRKVDDVLRRGKSELPRFLNEHLQERLKDYGLGIDVEHASVTKLDPPDQVKDAFDSLTQAQTNMRTQLNRAEQQANDKKSRARAKAYEIESSAKSYASAERIQASAEAVSFRKRLEQYRELSSKNPDYLNALWLDEIKGMLARMRDAGRIELLDHYLTSDGLTITQFPLQPRKK